MYCGGVMQAHLGLILTRARQDMRCVTMQKVQILHGAQELSPCSDGAFDLGVN